jgi:hypothetical protein
MDSAYEWVVTDLTEPPDPDSLKVDPDEVPPASQPQGDSTNPQGHNSETNSAAASDDRCGMTHLPSGRVCGLPARHGGSCDFHTAA